MDIYNETLEIIRNSINDWLIWVSIDETTDTECPLIGNVIVLKLCGGVSQSYLLNYEQLEECNHKIIAKLFNDLMAILRPNGIKHENVLFLSDAIPCIIKAGDTINVFYPKMLHPTCLAFTFSGVGETIRMKFTKVDKIIMTIISLFKGPESHRNI